MTETLKSTSEVVEALGGVVATAKLVERSPQSVWNWKDVGYFPGRTYLAITEALRRQGKAAPPSLWRMIEAGGNNGETQS